MGYGNSTGAGMSRVPQLDETSGLNVAKDAVVRGSGASRPWMACVRLLEPGTAQPGDAPDPRTTAAPPEASGLQRFSSWADPASLGWVKKKNRAGGPPTAGPRLPHRARDWPLFQFQSASPDACRDGCTGGWLQEACQLLGCGIVPWR